MRLADVVRTSEEVAAESGRNAKVRTLAGLLERLPPGEARVAVAYLSGRLPQGKIGVGPATLDDVLPVEPADESTLTLADVDGAVEEIAGVEGKGSAERRRDLLRDLFGRATGDEQDFLARLLLGELRQGAGEGLILEAVAEAAEVRTEGVHRASMLRGETEAVARAVLERGGEALEEFSLRLFRPVRPMLAQTADDVAAALERLGRAALEFKFDGARVQVHVAGDDVRVFTRRLNEKTAVVPEVVERVRELGLGEAVLDGEVLSFGPDGRPRPFQQTMRRFGRDADPAELRDELPLTVLFFDCLHLDGTSLLDAPGAERIDALAGMVPEEMRVPRRVTGDPGEAADFLDRALEAGHEGLLAKALDARYRAGRRGHEWLKVKPEYTADLVVLAAEWGHGRREGWLSNLHLGARVPDAGRAEEHGPASTADGEDRGEGRDAGGASPERPYPPGFAMVGKTFKGMTDRMLEWQTGRLQELERERRGRTVFVEPELVAEVAFDGVQQSPTYASGLALRFARVKGYREDKGPGEADTLASLRGVREGRRA